MATLRKVFKAAKNRQKAAARARVASTTKKKARQERFLELFPRYGTVNQTAKAVGLRTRDTVYLWLKKDPEFRRRYEEEAVPAAADRLEHAALSRAIEGVEKPAGFYQGRPIMTPFRDEEGIPRRDPKTREIIMVPLMVREYSDTLARFLLKGWKPERYGDKVEMSGPGRKPLAGPGILVIPRGGTTEEFIEGCKRVIEADQEDG